MKASFPILSHYQAKEILENVKQNKKFFYTSLDLEISREKVKYENGKIILPDKQTVPLKEIENILKDKAKCYVILENKTYPIVIFSEKTGWVRTLKPTKGAPTSTVGGFIMHRTKNIDPLKDTKLKLSKLKITKKSIVLDTCLGLGYTAIEAARLAKKVISVEIDEAALKIAKLNPYSQELFQMENIEIIIGDIQQVIKKFKDESFTHIIHDPPNMRLAGELYSKKLYQELYKKLKFRGILFHYIGNPEKRQGSSITKGVIRRLKETGFKKVKKEPQAFGVLAYKL